MTDRQLGVIAHLLIVTMVIVAATIITISERGNLPTSVGGLLGAALGISGTAVARDRASNGD